MNNIEKLSERMPVNNNAQLNNVQSGVADVSGMANIVKLLSSLPTSWNKLGTLANASLPGPSLKGLNADQIVTVLTGLSTEANSGGRVRAMLGFSNTTKGYLAKAKAVVAKLGIQGAAFNPFLTTLSNVILGLRGNQVIVNHFASCLANDKVAFTSVYNNDINLYTDALIKNKSMPLTDGTAPVPAPQPLPNESSLPSIDDALNRVNSEKSLLQQGIDWIKALFSRKGKINKMEAKEIASGLLDGKTVTVADGTNKVVPKIVGFMRVSKQDKDAPDSIVYENYKKRFSLWWNQTANKYITMQESHVSKLSEVRSAKSGDNFKQLLFEALKISPDSSANTVYAGIVSAMDIIIKDDKESDSKPKKYFRNIEYK